jgi:hypothetical protein
MDVWARMGLDATAVAVEFAKRYAGDLPARAYAEGQAQGFEEGFTQDEDFEALRPQMAAIASADPSLADRRGLFAPGGPIRQQERSR